MSQVLWNPQASEIRKSAIEHFAHRYAGCSATDYAELHQWSIDNPGKFWSHLWDFCQVKGVRGSGQPMSAGNAIKDTLWFPSARLNYAENLLYKDDEATAIIFVSENGEKRSISHKQLYLQVARLANFLLHSGVGVGDRVAGCLPNCIETIVAFLATSSIGAIWSSCSPDFGVQGILDRFDQIRPKVFLFVESYSWKGKEISIREKMQDVIAQLASLELAIHVPFFDTSQDSTSFHDACHWSDTQENSSLTINFKQLPFDHPLYILFSSGTTGAPKCIVHRAGGMLLQHLKEHRLHNDIRQGDRVFFFTTCGWMMWNWLVSALASKAVVMLYDGSPLYPRPETLLDYVESENISFFGTSARYLSTLENFDVSVSKSHNFSSLRTIGSTGSVLSEEGFDYVYRHISARVRLSSMSGGTDIVSCFVLGNPVLPVLRGELQCAGLGMQVAIVNERGQTVIDSKGELVCRNAFPAMPLRFWNDEDGSTYHKSYFTRFDNVWTHGDYALQTENGGFIIFGRSDTTLNPGGVRIGTAEIYRQIEKLPEVLESVVVGQNWSDDIRVVLCVVLAKGTNLDVSLQTTIKRTILANTSPKHVPDIIIAVPDIPRTRNGKISEVAVRDTINGEAVKNMESLENPNSLQLYRNLTELSSS